jgi:hypothetical protein
MSGLLSEGSLNTHLDQQGDVLFTVSGEFDLSDPGVYLCAELGPTTISSRMTPEEARDLAEELEQNALSAERGGRVLTQSDD